MSDQLEIRIDSLAHGGRGVGRVDGKTHFVEGALPGDEVRIAIESDNGRFATAKVVDVLTPSPDRCSAPCGVFGECGGCSWLNFAYPAQAEWKRQIVKDCFQRIARTEVDVAWIENPDLRLGYRTRATFHSDGAAAGFYAPASHEIVDITECPLCHPHLNEALKRFRDLNLDLSVEIVVNPEGDDILIWSENHLSLHEAFPEASGPAEPFRPSFLFDDIPIVCGAFSQSSLLLNRLLVKHVHECLAGSERVLDLYCGNGNLSLGLPDEIEVAGLDHDTHAIASAMTRGHGTYRVATERAFRKHVEKNQWDAVVLDPPRRGAKALMPRLANTKTSTIVYVSCDPATLARDVGALATVGWAPTSVTAIDMYPNTSHIETVCVLRRSE